MWRVLAEHVGCHDKSCCTLGQTTPHRIAVTPNLNVCACLIAFNLETSRHVCSVLGDCQNSQFRTPPPLDIPKFLPSHRSITCITQGQIDQIAICVVHAGCKALQTRGRGTCIIPNGASRLTGEHPTFPYSVLGHWKRDILPASLALHRIQALTSPSTVALILKSPIAEISFCGFRAFIVKAQTHETLGASIESHRFVSASWWEDPS